MKRSMKMKSINPVCLVDPATEPDLNTKVIHEMDVILSAINNIKFDKIMDAINMNANYVLPAFNVESISDLSIAQVAEAIVLARDGQFERVVINPPLDDFLY